MVTKTGSDWVSFLFLLLSILGSVVAAAARSRSGPGPGAALRARPGPLPLRLGGGVLRSGPGARSGPGTRPGSGRAGPGVRPGPGSRLVSVVGLDLESSAVELEIVLAFKSGLDAAPVAELDQAFAGARRVRVGVADLAGVAEEVLQILPGSPGGDVVNQEPVVGPHGGSASTEISASSPPVALPATVPRVLGHLDPDAASEEVAAVEVMDGIIGVTRNGRKNKVKIVSGQISNGSSG